MNPNTPKNYEKHPKNTTNRPQKCKICTYSRSIWKILHRTNVFLHRRGLWCLWQIWGMVIRSIWSFGQYGHLVIWLSGQYGLIVNTVIWSIWSSSHLVNMGIWSIRSSGHLIIQSSGHLVIWSSLHLVILSYDHLVIWWYGQYGYLVIRSSGHQVICSSAHLVIWSFPILWKTVLFLWNTWMICAHSESCFGDLIEQSGYLVLWWKLSSDKSYLVMKVI